MSKPKKIILRAFKVENNDPNYEKSPILNLLGTKLENSQMAEERRILLNQDDPNEESDLIADFDVSRKDVFIFGTMIRIMASKGTPNLPDDLFNQKKIPFNNLSKLELKEKFIYKSHFYFATDGNFLIVNLPSNRTITAFQAYINEYLKAERKKHLFEFTPLIVATPDTKVSNIKTIKFRDSEVRLPAKDKTSVSQSSFRAKVKNFKEELLRELLGDAPDFDKILEEDLVSAELLIKFASKKTDDPQKNLGAILKPIADTDNIEIKTNSGGTIKGSTLQKTKEVAINTTESDMISEAELFQAMETFLNELNN